MKKLTEIKKTLRQTKLDAYALSEYTREIENKLRFAEEQLADLSVGLLPSDLISKTSWDYATKLQASASRTLRDLSRMPKQSKPYTWRF